MGARLFNGMVPELEPYADYLYTLAMQAGYRPTVTSVVRSRQKQAVLYQRYLRGQSSLPAAPPGSSYHEVGRAFDMVVAAGKHSAQQAAVGRLWQSWGGTWGGARDPVHFQA